LYLYVLSSEQYYCYAKLENGFLNGSFQSVACIQPVNKTNRLEN